MQEPFRIVPEAQAEGIIRVSLEVGLTAEQIHADTGIALDRVRFYIRKIQCRSNPLIVPAGNAFVQAATACKRGGRFG